MKRELWLFAGAGALLSLISACGGEDNSSDVPAVGSITGTISISNQFIPATAPGTSRVLTSDVLDISAPNEPTEFVLGEIIVAFKSGTDEQVVLADLLHRYTDIGLTDAGLVYPGGPRLFRTSVYQNSSYSNAAAKAATRNVVEQLSRETTIDYAEFNGIRQAQLMPNDPTYLAGLQWNINLIQMPAAWEITTGSPSVVVAVLDTGIRNHSDLNANLLSTGYDFVDNDSDPTESLFPTASFHGTHVAGTIAAIGNNNAGMTGIAWNTKIMPIRVLGSLGRGTDTAILNGMLYAAQLPNSSGTLPLQRAHIINMSLSSSQACPSSYQNVINNVVSAGLVVIAAAGNQGEATVPITPASCQGVISVAAVDPLTRLASYSNYQPYVTIAAPGGELNDGIHNAILSTLSDSGAGQFSYKFQQGTSMAAPHVAGVAALMLSTNPNLTPSQVKTILSGTAQANLIIDTRNTGGGLTMDIAVPFGLLDASAAVAVAAGYEADWAPTVPIPWPFPAAAAAFGQIIMPMQMSPLRIWNAGDGALTISGIACWTEQHGAYDCAPGHSWLSIAMDENCSSIAPVLGSSCDYTVTADPTGLSFGQQYVGLVAMESNGGMLSMPVFIQYGPPAQPSSIGPLSIQLWTVNHQTGEPIQKISEVHLDSVGAISDATFTFTNVPAGQYIVVSGVDINSNGVFGDAPGETEMVSETRIISVTSGQTADVEIEIFNVPDGVIASL